MKNEVHELRKQVRAARAGGKRGPFPRELRGRLQAHLRPRWEAGESLVSLAEELELSLATLHYWRGQWGSRRKQESLKIVQVISETPAGLTMHGPGGTRVEDLTTGEVVELWRRMS